MDGLLQCTKYAFGPNRLHYCGPDANSQIFSYLENEKSDFGLTSLLRNFQTMFPYLKQIAAANRIRDPFDSRVVEAYWIGNNLLSHISKNQLYTHLIEDHGLKKRLSPKDFMRLSDKVGQGALPHHSFHVLNIWRRTGHVTIGHTLESLDACRISWGKVLAVDGPNITLESEPLLYLRGRLCLGEAVKKTITRNLDTSLEIDELAPGQIVTFHWNVPCEVITPAQTANLKKYTLLSIKLANQTI